jgi:hypothetical protein
MAIFPAPAGALFLHVYLPSASPNKAMISMSLSKNFLNLLSKKKEIFRFFFGLLREKYLHRKMHAH